MTTVTQAPADIEETVFADDADFVVRSADGAHFRVHKLVVGLASPLFKDMFEMPQAPPACPDEESADTFPMVTVAESKEILRLMLSFCYSGILGTQTLINLTWADLEKGCLLMDAARKYMMKPLLDHVTGRILRIAELSPEMAVRVFAIACRFELKDMARIAARYSLQHAMKPLSDLNASIPEEFEYVSLAAYIRLTLYHQRCVEEAREVATDLRWTLTAIRSRPLTFEPYKSNHQVYRQLSASQSFTWFKCEQCTGKHEDKITVKVEDIEQIFTPRSWWKEYMDSLAELLDEIPSPSVVGKPDTLGPALAQATKCSTCGPTAYAELMEFNEYLKRRIDASMIMVTPDL